MSLEQKIADTVELLQIIASDFQPAVFAHSFGAEDMVINDLVAKHAIGIDIFSLDTGRLPTETYALMEKAGEAYPAHPIRVFFPNTAKTEAFVNREGINPFYRSIELRKACCQIRKIEPLTRALAGKKAWVTGLRREQSPTRKDLGNHEWDEGNQLEKFNPLIEWTENEVWQYIRDNHVPYNELHDRHYPSIGCAPCTRAIAMGEDVRAGRWWWENPDSKECGLHPKK